MTVLLRQPWWAILVELFVLGLGTLALARALVPRLFPGDQAERASVLAATLTAAFGALFAFLSAFLITNEWTQHNAAETAIANEAAAAARVIWSADTPGVDRVRISDAAGAYLSATGNEDWSEMERGRIDALPSDDPYRNLQAVVRSEATDTDVEAPSKTEMLSALDALAQGRRDRLVAADRVMPAALYGVVVISGLVLIVNSMVVASPRRWRTGRLVGSVAIVVALDLSLILIISGPFQGSYVASPKPLQRVAAQLADGWFKTG